MARFWNDLVVRVESSLVANIVHSFIKSYMNAHGKDTSLCIKKPTLSLGKMNAWIVDHSPFRHLFNLQKIYKTRLEKAEKRIILITPYFIPRRWLVATMHQAVLRGVTIEILLPAHTNIFFLDRLHDFYMRKLSELGITFFVENTMNHAKAMIVDSDEAMVGSQNLDFLSFDLNSEVGVFFKDAEVVTKLLEIIEIWKRDSHIFDPKSPLGWFDYIIASAIKLFAKIF